MTATNFNTSGSDAFQQMQWETLCPPTGSEGTFHRLSMNSLRESVTPFPYKSAGFDNCSIPDGFPCRELCFKLQGVPSRAHLGHTV
ncbi:hypothetical protein HN873_033524 [Arachis hypogaea]